MALPSPYLAPGFYDRALAAGKHRDIVGGRWDETARAQMAALHDAGLTPTDHLLDIGCGSLRLGHKAVAYLDPGHYWGTDASAALMQRGWDTELPPDLQARLRREHLVEDAHFTYPGIPATITMAIAFGVFTHLPAETLAPALANLRATFPALRKLLLTVFLGPETDSHRQPDGVVTHASRPPYHRTTTAVEADAQSANFAARWSNCQLPRGQRLCLLTPA